MTLADLIANDFETVVDFLRPITVGGAAVEKALRRAIKTREMQAGNGKYLASDTVFHFAKSAYMSRPDIGLAIVDNGETWTVLEVAEETLSNRWKCFARRLILQNPISIAVRKLVYAKSATGAMVGTYEPSISHVEANVVWINEKAELVGENMTSPRSAKVQFIRQMELTASHRLVLPDGRTLKLLSWSGFNSVSQLFEADCEEVV